MSRKTPKGHYYQLMESKAGKKKIFSGKTQNVFVVRLISSVGNKYVFCVMGFIIRLNTQESTGHLTSTASSPCGRENILS